MLPDDDCPLNTLHTELYEQAIQFKIWKLDFGNEEES